MIKEEQLMCGIKLCLSIKGCGVRKAHFCSKDMMERRLRDWGFVHAACRWRNYEYNDFNVCDDIICN